ncbi:hypothetical protein [Olleya namhaensis]|uniref:hypothetical protein n=1 Tax=Olleya namhaensis TaxID=1144750 RepID=UPI0024909D48|nr:hypothetical protein [Olleya namhaensis]
MIKNKKIGSGTLLIVVALFFFIQFLNFNTLVEKGGMISVLFIFGLGVHTIYDGLKEKKKANE